LTTAADWENQTFLNLVNDCEFAHELLGKYDYQAVEDGRLETGISNPVSSLRFPFSFLPSF